MVPNASWALILVVSLGTASAAEVEVRRHSKELWKVSRQAARDASAQERLRIVPRHVDDEIDGFVLQNLEDAPTLTALGFETGDLVRSIDGQRLDSPQTVLAIRAELMKREAPFDVLVEVVRDGQSISRTIHID
jgi:type II secretory pathway component PulC